VKPRENLRFPIDGIRSEGFGKKEALEVVICSESKRAPAYCIGRALRIGRS
jgi:hypothetical protein